MSIGIKCLISENYKEAETYASELLKLNTQRRDIELKMHKDALSNIKLEKSSLLFSICLYDKKWHQGVIGILASRIKEKYFRPTIVFADDKKIYSAESLKVGLFK